MKSLVLKKQGYSLVEVLIALAITSLSINFYMQFASQTYSTSAHAKNYLQAVSIMNNLYQDITVSSSTSWVLNTSYVTLYDALGRNPSVGPNFFTVTIDVQTFATVPTLKDLKCRIQWDELGVPQRMDFHVVK